MECESAKSLFVFVAGNHHEAVQCSESLKSTVSPEHNDWPRCNDSVEVAVRLGIPDLLRAAIPIPDRKTVDIEKCPVEAGARLRPGRTLISMLIQTSNARGN